MSFVASRCRRAATTLLLCVVAPRVHAQGTAIVPPGDLAYADVDRLAELGMLDSVIIGQRPYSRREFTRIVRTARETLVRRVDDERRERSSVVVNAILGRLAERFDAGPATEAEGAEGAALSLIDAASLTLGKTDAVRRGLAGSLANGIEATIDPLAVRRLGTPAPSGRTVALELSQLLDVTRWLSFHATERLEHRVPRDTTLSRRAGELLTAGARARFRNVALRIGREQVTWSQSSGDGLFLASDAPALDLVSLGGDRPFLLPGMLRLVGPTQATLVLAELGPSVVRSHSKLLAYKVSIQPRRDLELGATFMNHYGGSGGRASGFGNRLVDFLPFVDIFRAHNYTDTTRMLDVDSDKLLGVDGRLRIARLGGLVVTGELLIDDFDVHRIRTLFTWDGAQTLGIVAPRIAGSAFSVQLSAKHTGVRTYAHGVLSNGIATRGRLLGDELGPDAKAFGATVRWEPLGPVRTALEGRSATYSKSSYVTEERGTYFVIRRVGAASNELRDRAVASLVADLADGLALTARVAAERIRNAAFLGGTRHDYAAELAVRFAR
jgi:hypothetical protein